MNAAGMQCTQCLRKLLREFSKRRTQGKIIKNWWWIISRAKNLSKELNPDIKQPSGIGSLKNMRAPWMFIILCKHWWTRIFFGPLMLQVLWLTARRIWQKKYTSQDSRVAKVTFKTEGFYREISCKLLRERKMPWHFHIVRYRQHG